MNKILNIQLTVCGCTVIKKLKLIFNNKYLYYYKPCDEYTSESILYRFAGEGCEGEAYTQISSAIIQTSAEHMKPFNDIVRMGVGFVKDPKTFKAALLGYAGGIGIGEWKKDSSHSTIMSMSTLHNNKPDLTGLVEISSIEHLELLMTYGS